MGKTRGEILSVRQELVDLCSSQNDCRGFTDLFNSYIICTFTIASRKAYRATIVGAAQCDATNVD
jgi:hypothetical protein